MLSAVAGGDHQGSVAATACASNPQPRRPSEKSPAELLRLAVVD
eukprot:CAMPEP_0185482178 /NCGR_PEP_ID=MMETSP1366-20130426/7572_1 /TAXON_ID=38817 /ORGANISM="Gephyrocapsa oceanica, Strain RCC1303" /LENGTH=43 /DNA_ID= /DNA_START= /DNA_END= /DNA_ORIENTATION=